VRPHFRSTGFILGPNGAWHSEQVIERASETEISAGVFAGVGVSLLRRRGSRRFRATSTSPRQQLRDRSVAKRAGDSEVKDLDHAPRASIRSSGLMSRCTRPRFFEACCHPPPPAEPAAHAVRNRKGTVAVAEPRQAYVHEPITR